MSTKPYLVVGMIVYNESKFIRHTLEAVYNSVDEFIIVDHHSTDDTIDIIKDVDRDSKITIIKRKWDNDYSKARNTYLDHIKKKIYPKHRRDLYYWRIDGDEVYYTSQVENLKGIIEENPDKAGFRCNFYSFTQDEGHLDEKMPHESRGNIFRYTPDIRYSRSLHELPVHPTNNTPLYGDPMQDSELGIFYLQGFWYCHFAWTDVERCVVKAKNYTEHYVKDGTETKEHLNTIEAKKDSWWWNKKSELEFKAKYPEVFDTIGYLDGMSANDGETGEKKISAFTIVKNAIEFDYPIVEAINSVLPFVDEVVVNLGIPDNDGTSGMLHKLFDGIDKVKFFESEWEKREDGVKFLTNQTNIAKDKCENEWCLYFQADELYHQKDYKEIKSLVEEYGDRKDILGFRFKWLHFDGDFASVNTNSYPEEIRLVRRDAVESIGDAQSFGVKGQPGTNLMGMPDNTIESDVNVFHYGWTREPDKMLEKLRDFDKFYHNDTEWNEMHKDDETKHKDGKYDYGSRDEHFLFEEEHPLTMYPRITRFERKYKDICKGFAQWTKHMPVCSLIIPTWNMSHLLKNTLEGIAKSVDVPFEVIVVNNDSTDDTREYLDQIAEGVLKANKHFRELKSIHNPENRCLAGGINIGVAHSIAPFISIVANDIIVPPGGFYNFAIQKLLKDGTIGAIGPWYTEEQQYIQGPGSAVDNFHANYDSIPKSNELVEDWHFSVCHIIRRDNWELIGPWDEKYVTHCNDNDWGIRQSLLGYKAVTIKEAVCYHQYGSFGRKQIPNESGEAEVDGKYFHDKWGIHSNQPNSEIKEDAIARAKEGNFITDDQMKYKINWKKMEAVQI